MYSLLVDDLAAVSDKPRSHLLAEIDLQLDRPFDDAEAEEWEREHWGLMPDQIAGFEALFPDEGA